MYEIDPGELERFARTLIRRIGPDETVAEDVAASLVTADLVGHRSHGVIRIPHYNGNVEAGKLDPTALPEVVDESETTAIVDGNRAFGPTVGRMAVDVATSKARENGVAVVGIRDSGHIGRTGQWSEAATEDGLLFGAFGNLQGGAQSVAPPDSAERTLGTNPISFGVPTFDALPFPIVLDMATSQVAHGKIIEREDSGETLPEAWTITDSGDPVETAAAFQNGAGALLPLGGRAVGHKGFGLSVVAELFAGIAGDTAVATGSEREWDGNAAMFVACDPTRFTTRERIRERVSGLRDHLKSVERIDSEEDVLLPGEPEYRTRREYDENGIPFPDQVVDSLREFAIENDAGEDIPDAFRE